MSINPMKYSLWTLYDLALLGLILAISNAMGYLTLDSIGMTALVSLVTVAGVGAVKEYLVG